MAGPSFYCENCGRKVSSSLETCPGCGQSFSSVRCPSCGFTGVPELFKESCPRCGYAGTDVVDKNPGRNFYIVKSESDETNSGKRSEKKLPSWLYKVLIAFLALTLIGLVRIYFLL